MCGSGAAPQPAGCGAAPRIKIFLRFKGDLEAILDLQTSIFPTVNSHSHLMLICNQQTLIYISLYALAST